MPIRYDVAHDGKLVVEVWTGEITRADLIAHQTTSLADPAIVPGRVELVDITRATGPGIGEREIKEFTDFYRSHPDKAQGTRIGVVASGEGFNQARIFERLTVPHLITVVVFNEIDTACTWLGVDEGEIRRIIDSILTESSTHQ